MSTDRPLVGIALMLGFCALAPMGDAVAKLLGQSVPLGQMLLVRYAIQVLMLVPLVMLTGRAWRVRGRVLWLSVLRMVLQIVGITAMFEALRHLALADAIAILFVMPFILLILGHLVLKEEIGIRRLLACAVGFAGTLMVVQPSFQEVGLPALLPIVVALVFSVFILVTRSISPRTDPVGLQAVNGVMSLAVMIPLAIWGHGAGWPELTFRWPVGQEGPLLLAIGVLGTLAHLLMTWSLRFAPAATLAPMQYLEIPIATLIGWVVFSDLPDGLAAIGIVITVAAGLYVVMRERAMTRIAPQVP